MKSKTARVVRIPGRRAACMPMLAMVGGESVPHLPDSRCDGTSGNPPRRQLPAFAGMHSKL